MKWKLNIDQSPKSSTNRQRSIRHVNCKSPQCIRKYHKVFRTIIKYLGKGLLDFHFQ